MQSQILSLFMAKEAKGQRWSELSKVAQLVGVGAEFNSEFLVPEPVLLNTTLFLLPISMTWLKYTNFLKKQTYPKKWHIFWQIYLYHLWMSKTVWKIRFQNAETLR